jgi:hypothetical protein
MSATTAGYFLSLRSLELPKTLLAKTPKESIGLQPHIAGACSAAISQAMREHWVSTRRAPQALTINPRKASKKCLSSKRP